MANSYTQIYVQLIFAVKERQNFIHENHRNEIEKYVCGIILNKKSKPLSIYCNPDHIHILIGLHPTISVSDIVRDIKASSSKWINENNWFIGKFHWQDGFGAFTYAKSQIDKVVKYIQNQPIHHKKMSFKEEYISFLEKYEIEYDKRYIFESYD